MAGASAGAAGPLPVESSFAERRLHLGYREITLAQDGALGPAGARYRGHEFHYATVLAEGEGEALFTVADATGRDLGTVGRCQARLFGSFMHLIDRTTT